MNKEIYLKGKDKKVQIGEVITIGGAKLELTEFIIENNRELFRVVEEVVPEYVEIIVTKGCFNKGEILRTEKYLNGGWRFVWSDDSGQVYNEYYTDFFKPSTKEAYDRQELMKKARKMYEGLKVGTRIKGIEWSGIISTENYKLEYEGGDIFIPSVATDFYSIDIYRKDGKWAEIIKPKEKQVFWLCNQDLGYPMEDRSFSKGKFYNQINDSMDDIKLVDDCSQIHYINGDWKEKFTRVITAN